MQHSLLPDTEMPTKLITFLQSNLTGKPDGIYNITLGCLENDDSIIEFHVEKAVNTFTGLYIARFDQYPSKFIRIYSYNLVTQLANYLGVAVGSFAKCYVTQLKIDSKIDLYLDGLLRGEISVENIQLITAQHQHDLVMNNERVNSHFNKLVGGMQHV
ncbi:hypothetical protein OH460_07880 [Vibrio sp. Makdt]|uniref:hypothetical protein n=1 Tax=Vibrio sp. Makdt TaxID=2998828 RepID=UPI0022CD9188|nr:hypothetical protein [Vibrio sp. Makdt]MDA0152216.1 hypothetical protein [Vibrio sp. Makdt]